MKAKSRKIKVKPASSPESASRQKKTNAVKVRLDYRTIIVLKSMSALKAWRKRYPEAKVLAA